MPIFQGRKMTLNFILTDENLCALCGSSKMQDIVKPKYRNKKQRFTLDELNIRSSFRIFMHEFPALLEVFNINHLKFNKQRVSVLQYDILTIYVLFCENQILYSGIQGS